MIIYPKNDLLTYIPQNAIITERITERTFAMRKKPIYFEREREEAAEKKAPSAKKKDDEKPKYEFEEWEQQCPVRKKCSGCQLSNMPYKRQLEFKQKKVAMLLDRYAKIEPIIGMDVPYHYRTKVQSALTLNSHGDIISGVYQSSTGGVVYCKSGCLTEDKRTEKAAAAVRKLMRSFKVMPYDRRTGRGTLRHVLIKRGIKTDQLMIVLVSATPVFPCGKKFAAALKEECHDVETVIFTVNKTETNLLVTGRETVLLGKGYIEDEMLGKRFRISAKSFYQINPYQTEKLYSKAVELAQLDKNSKVIDAYCGTGTIGIIAADKAGEVIGCELNEDAVKDAVVNAKLNKCENVRFFCSDAGQFMQGAAYSGEFVPDVVFMDPPRAGADKAFIGALCSIAPKRIVYISCNPETLARDLRLLCSGGYKAETICPVDMFPHTQHVETVCLMSRVEGK